MNQILKEFMPKNTISFLDDVSIKDCKEEAKDLTLEEDGCYTFVKKHIKDEDCILKKLEEVNLTLFFKKIIFGFKEIIFF